MGDQSAKLQALKEDFLHQLPNDLATRLIATEQRDRCRTQAIFTDAQERQNLTLSDVLLWQSYKRQPGLIVVKNINLAWVAALSEALGVDISFFVEHAQNPAGTKPWDAVFPRDEFEKRKAAPDEHPVLDKIQSISSSTWHLDGVLEYCTQDRQSSSKSTLHENNVFPRLLWYDNVYGWNVTMRFSYTVVNQRYHILLVDSPPQFGGRAQQGQDYSEVWLPLSRNRGGVMLPHPYGSFDMTSIFDSFCSHAWHVRALTTLSNSGLNISPKVLFYLIIASTWTTNMRILKGEVESLAFKEIRRPDIQINDRLHNCRQYLTYLREETAMTKQWIPFSVAATLIHARKSLSSSEHVDDPGERLVQILKDAKALDKFLMDTFQILMSTMTVLDVQRSVQQASRAQKVTTLAFVYVPLSFVTGIFGMNVAEINGSPLSVWVPVVALVIVMACTVVMFSWEWIYTKIWLANQLRRERKYALAGFDSQRLFTSDSVGARP